MTEVVCRHCGRKGTRGFVLLFGTGDGAADGYVCASTSACERRQSTYVWEVKRSASLSAASPVEVTPE